MGDIKIEVIDRPDGEKLAKIYSLYQKIFVLKDGKENLRGFEEDLKFNQDKRLIEKYGPFKEVWLSMSSGGKIIGAINFSIYLMPKHIVKKYNVGVTSQVIYILVDKDYRKQGLGNKLLLLAEQYSKKFAKEYYDNNKINLLSFCDFYSPELMTLREYKQDFKSSNIDPCDRAIFWCNHGFKQIEFNYVIPPLNKHEKSCHLLVLNVKSNKSKIVNEVVFEHLKRFFEISVLKENNLKNYSYTLEKHDLLSKKSLTLKNKKKSFILLKNNITSLIGSCKKSDFDKKISKLF